MGSPKSTGVDCANMDLFHMKRYWSDGEEQEENEDQPGLNSEADILNRLKNKVQKEEKQPGQPDILVATPGRIVDHIQKTQGFSLEHLRFLVVDEADRVMEDIQNDWLNQVEGAVYSSGKRPRPGPLTVANALKKLVPLQKLLFSATLSQNPEKLEQMNLFEPKLFTSVVQPKDICAKKEVDDEVSGEFAGKYTTPA